MFEQMKQLNELRKQGQKMKSEMEQIVVDVSEGDIQIMIQGGGTPAFERVKGYHFATCLNVNEGIVHGIPTSQKLKEGDILSVDLGTFYQGFNTDASWTVYIGDEQKTPRAKTKFLRAGEEALKKAIAEAREGN